MDREKMMQERHELLTRLQDELQQDLIAAQIREPEADEPEILGVIFDDLGMKGEQAFGEFFFMPVDSDDVEIQHFTGVVTIADDLSGDHLPELFEAIAYINYYLPVGGYSVDPDRQYLSYKLTVPLDVSVSGEELYGEMGIVLDTAANVVDAHMDLLLQLLDGDVTLDTIRESLSVSTED